MAKKLSKRALLDHLIAEVAKLRSEVKALGRDVASVTERVASIKPKAAKGAKPAAKRAVKKAAPVTPASRRAGAAPKRPVLVPAPAARSETS